MKHYIVKNIIIRACILGHKEQIKKYMNSILKVNNITELKKGQYVLLYKFCLKTIQDENK